MNKRLLYSAVLAAALSSSAQAQVSEPQLPSPATLKLDGTDTVYIYNTAAKQWLSYGNHWGTQLSLKAAGNAMGVAIVPNKKNNTFDGTYTLYNNSNGSWTRRIFMDTADKDKSTAFVDYNNQAAWKTKFVLHNANQTTFQIQVDTISTDIASDATLADLGETRVAYDPNIVAEDKDGNATNTGEGWVSPTMPVSSITTLNGGADWQAYSKEEFEKYSYRLSTLMEAINSAVEAGIDVSAEITVYNSATATLVELQTAYKQVKIKLRNATLTEATIDAPVDITEYVASANCQSLTGWDTSQGSYDNDGNITDGTNHGYGTKWQVHSSTYTATDGTEITKFIERWVNRNSHYDPETGKNTNVANAGHLSDSKIFQTLEGLPAGGYEVSAYVNAVHQGIGQNNGIDASNSGVHLFINDVKTQIYTEEGKPQKFTTIAVVGDDGNLSFGLELKDCKCNWLFMCNYEVKYYGNDAIAILLINAQNKADEYAEKYDGVEANEKLVEALDDAIKAVGNLSASSTEAEIRAALAAMEAAAADVDTNIAKYEELQSIYSEWELFISEAEQGTYDTEVLDSFLEDGSEGITEDAYQDITGDHSLDNDQLDKYIAKFKELIEAAQKSGIKEGKDIPTALLADPSFENNGNGWSGKQTVNSTYQNCEAYQATFDMYQEITGIPSGVYTVKAQAFQRVAFNDNASILYSSTNSGENITTYLYGNDIKKQVASPYSAVMATASEGSPADYSYNGGYVPNSMQGFMKACEEGLYDNEVSVLVTDGTLRFGIKCAESPNQGNGWWSIWDNFRVRYEGGMDNTEALSKVTGQLTAEANDLLTQKMSTDSLSALTAAVEAVKATPSQATILALNSAVAAAKNSIATYATLKAAIDDVDTRYEAYDYRSEEARTTFATAKTTAENAYNNGTAKDSEVSSVIYDLKKAFTAYIIYDDAKAATVENPKDVSYVMSNYDFASNDQTGWSGTPGAFQDGLNEMEYYNKTFDFYQEIPGMPAGRYELTVQAFHRQGFVQNMKDSLANGSLKDPALIYLNDNATPIVPLYKGATTATAGVTDYVAYDETAGTYVPNTMTTALAEFSDETRGQAYLATISHYVAEATDFKIGAKKETNINGDWTIFNSFTLKYLGNGTDGIESITSGKTQTGVVGTQVYNVNGVATGKLQKGLNIVKTTLSDGTVKVSKVIVK